MLRRAQAKLEMMGDVCIEKVGACGQNGKVASGYAVSSITGYDGTVPYALIPLLFCFVCVLALYYSTVPALLLCAT